AYAQIQLIGLFSGWGACGDPFHDSVEFDADGVELVLRTARPWLIGLVQQGRVARDQVDRHVGTDQVERRPLVPVPRAVDPLQNRSTLFETEGVRDLSVGP